MVNLTAFYDTRLGRYFRRFNNWRLFKGLKPGEIAIDCGANIGKLTLIMAKRGAQVYAFEPDPAAFNELEKNLEGYKNVTLYNQAVSDHSGRARFYFSNCYQENPKKWSTGSSLIEEKPNVDKENFIEVELVDFAEFVKGLEKPVALIKMDIEGEEVKVMNHLIDSGLISRIKKMVVETHERIPALSESTEKLRERIKSLGIKNIDLDWA